MRRASYFLLGAVLLALWGLSIARTQPTVGPDEQTVHQQMTHIAGPTPTPRSTRGE